MNERAEAGAKNAGVLACQILALQDKNLARRLVRWKQKLEDEVAEAARKTYSR